MQVRFPNGRIDGGMASLFFPRNDLLQVSSIVAAVHQTRPLSQPGFVALWLSRTASSLRRSASSSLEMALHSTNFGISRACFKATKRFLAVIRKWKVSVLS